MKPLQCCSVFEKSLKLGNERSEITDRGIWRLLTVVYTKRSSRQLHGDTIVLTMLQRGVKNAASITEMSLCIEAT